jgi:hypothetical protein
MPKHKHGHCTVSMRCVLKLIVAATIIWFVFMVMFVATIEILKGAV